MASVKEEETKEKAEGKAEERDDVSISSLVFDVTEHIESAWVPGSTRIEGWSEVEWRTCFA